MEAKMRILSGLFWAVLWLSIVHDMHTREQFLQFTVAVGVVLGFLLT